jgi:ElaB/YqjD/DUF883 family membrane-anchored ribosome-binding protein
LKAWDWNKPARNRFFEGRKTIHQENPVANPNTPQTNENEITSLRAEVARLTKIVSSQGAQAYSDVRGRAAQAVDAVGPAARKTVDAAKAEGGALAQTAREHPAAAGSVMVLAAALGMLVGYALGASSQPEPPRRRYW